MPWVRIRENNKGFQIDTGHLPFFLLRIIDPCEKKGPLGSYIKGSRVKGHNNYWVPIEY